MQETIILENVTKSYGDFKAVDNISLRIHAGEIYGFLGVNGAGKTTTLRMLAGVLRPTLGRVIIGGFDMSTDPIAAKRITGYIPDRPYLYAKLTAREFLTFVADLYSVQARTAQERATALLEEYGLTNWEHELIESFSHGMKQRLATCAALIHGPRILVIDEPMVGLDPHGAKMLKEALRSYAKEGMTIFLSTHSLNVAEEVADRLAIMHRGAIICTGTLDDIRKETGDYQNDLEDLFIELTSSAMVDMSAMR
jgi:ABC-2 type transport system ATP-binding protein